MDPNTSGIRTWQWVVTAIVIIILIVIGVMVFGNKGEEGTVDNGTSTTTQGTATALNRIVMSDQYPGNVVFISSVQFDKAGWVAIHKDSNGKPGAVIGYAYFEKGISPGRITLSEPTVENGVYYAVLHTDNGDKKWNEAQDAALKDASGNVIMKLFRASASVGAEIKG